MNKKDNSYPLDIFKRINKTLLLSMRILTLLLCIGLTSMYANPTIAQTKIDITLENASFKDLFNEIEAKSEFVVFYKDDVLEANKKLSINLKKITISALLDKAFQKTNLVYSILNRQIIVKRKEPFPLKIGTSNEVLQQQFQVNGTIIDADNTPLPGANIVEKGTTNGVTADFDGNFSITLANEKATLVASYIGFATEEIMVNGQTNINIVLVESLVGLEDVVVIGYGTVKKSDLTGSVSSLREEDFNPGANASIDQMMLGRAAGVNISQTSAEPGGGIAVRIRGASSVNAGSDPLYVIDGFPIDNSAAELSNANLAGIGTNSNPRNPLNSINPNDIHSIEILKDASATAIYGSRGANGVILITTKKGQDGRIKINYNTQLGVQTVANRFNLLSTQDYITNINAIAAEGGQGVQFTPEQAAAVGAGTDWQDEIFRSAILQQHDISVSGGTDKTTYFASGNYFNQDGVVINSGIEKFIGRLNLETKLGKKVKLGVNLSTSQIKDNNSTDGLQINEAAGPIYTSLTYDPTEPIFNTDGTLSQSPLLTINNPRASGEGVNSNSVTNRTIGNFYIDYSIVDNLSARLNFGSDRENLQRDIFNSGLTISGNARGGIADVNTVERSNVLLEYTMDYRKEINENNFFSILGGVTYQEFLTRSVASNISGFPSDVLGTNNLLLGNIATARLASNKQGNTLLSYLGRVNYNLYDKILLTASVRADGSSRFGINNKYGIFPSFAVGYKLADEDFIPDAFDNLKLRASWGATGNQEIGNFNSISTFGTGPNAVFANQLNTGSIPTRVANPDLKWETTEQFNVGIDFSLLNNRFSGTLDYFIKTTSDQLIEIPLPIASGFGSVLSNLGELQNRGFELFLSSNNISTKDFSWTTSLNFATLKNKVTDLDGFGPILTGNVQDVGNTTIIREGAALASYFGFQVDGIFQSDTDFTQTAQPNGRPGDPIFRDVNGDGTINPDDRVILGNALPDYTFGINNSFTYKDFQFDFFIQGQQGVDLININQIESFYPNNFRRNRIADQILDRWTPQNPDAKFPSGVNPFAYGGSKVNSLVVSDASYIRLKNVQLIYNVPVNRIKLLQSLRLSLIGQDLITITDYEGFNPEANSFGRGNARIDYSSYPNARTIILAVNIGI
jgi:TonB-linked SusC/RagA family outer membrane protein